MEALDVLREQVAQWQSDPAVQGVLLNGSWAGGCATPQSDLDLLVLCDEDRFTAQWVGNVLVETHYFTVQTAREKLAQNPMEVYRYLGASVQFDRGALAELTTLAEQQYQQYRTPEHERRRLAHWMATAELKLRTALENGNVLQANYIASANAWPLLEATWAINNRPMPPQSMAFRRWNELQIAFSAMVRAGFFARHAGNAQVHHMGKRAIADPVE
ncbi:MAG: nucleotidyltransferase domain-containing protein [Oscillospiraceae bacterium]|nr:nucleotidyltransferase domain-containing protein [Oscillospiraceae bacterium]